MTGAQLYQSQTGPLPEHAPTNPRWVHKHPCANFPRTGCVNPIWSHLKAEINHRPYWQFCDRCYSALALDYTIGAVEVPPAAPDDDDWRDLIGGSR